MLYTKEMYKAVLWEPISILNLPHHLITKLELEGIWTIADLVTKSFPDLISIPGVGVKTIDKIDQALMQHGVRLESSRCGLLRPGVREVEIDQFNKRQMEASGCL